MKNLKLRHFLYSILAICFTSIVLSSCQEEEMTYQLQEASEERNLELEEQLASLPFKKSLVIANQADHHLGMTEMLFIIKSNDKDILNHVTENSITLKAGNISFDDNPSYKNEGSSNEMTNSGELSGFKKGRKIVQIIFVGSTTAAVSTNYSGFSIEFSDELVDHMRSNNVGSVIDFGPDDSQLKKGRDINNFTLYNKNKEVNIDGDGSRDGKKTITQNYWAYTNSSTTYRLNRTYFYNFTGVAVCCLRDRNKKWVRRIQVMQDYVRGVYGINDRCTDGSCQPYSS